MSSVNRPDVRETCWFYNNHEDGCINVAAICKKLHICSECLQNGHNKVNCPKLKGMDIQKDIAPGIVSCWYYNNRTEGCTNEASHCKKLHICSHCHQSGHPKLNCPQFEGSDIAKDAPPGIAYCWFYNNQPEGCTNHAADCKKLHICSECAQHGHGRLNCPELRKKRANQLKDVLPALEEWRTESTCWFYNFSSKTCNNEASGCKKQHACNNCHQGGHPHLTCPALLPGGQGATSKRAPSMDEWKYETSCWFFNFGSKGCSAGVGCKKLHICSECHQAGHTHQDCPVAIRGVAAPMEVDRANADTLLEKRETPALKVWLQEKSCWFYNFSTTGCQNDATTCKKEHHCSVCKENVHGNLNCPQIRKRRAAKLKDVLPSLEEWKTDATCWFYNFSTISCNNDSSVCKKQHKCSNCLQTGHPRLTCPEPVTEKLATRAAAPTMDEWRNEDSCWFYNFGSEGCVNGTMCKKRHVCSDCYQVGHSHITCPTRRMAIIGDINDIRRMALGPGDINVSRRNTFFNKKYLYRFY